MASTTKTTTKQEPPQLMPEGRPGYLAANEFYRGQLAQPDVYGGQRFAEPGRLQRGAFTQAQNVFGGAQGPAYRQGAEASMERTRGGDWMFGPEAQAAVKSMSQPIFERFENQTIPGIRDTSQAATGGMGGSRRTVENQNAIQELGYNLGQGALAPIYTGERERMVRGDIEGSTALANQDIARTAAAAQMGEQERQMRELPIKAERDIFEEGLARRGASAESLTAAATTGPGGTTQLYNPSVMRMILGSGKA